MNAIASSRNFANKIRNAARFVQMNLDGYVAGEPQPTTAADLWIFSRLAKLVRGIEDAYIAFDFGAMTRALYTFFWNEFCDWYIELSKVRLQAEGDDRLACQRNLVFVLDTALRLLHPIMPFVTEEIFDSLPGNEDAMLMMAAWPNSDDYAQYVNDAAERAMVLATETVTAIRATRARYGISPKKGLDVLVKASGEDADALASQSELVSSLANLDSFTVGADVAKPAESSVTLVAGAEVYAVLAGLVDFEAERARLAKQEKDLEKDVAKLEKKLSNPGYLAKAKPEIIEKDKAKFEEASSKLSMVRTQLAELG